MSTLSSRFLLVAAALVAPVFVSGAQSAEARRAATQAAERARAHHVLNRLAFGPRPGEVERVVATGVDRWIDRQLRPESVVDTMVVNGPLRDCLHWSLPVAEAMASAVGSIGSHEVQISSPNGETRMVRTNITPSAPIVIPRDSASRVPQLGPLFRDNAQFLACRLTRMEYSERQLLEVMTDFWNNHFSVWASRFPSRATVIEWDRTAIRDNALGRFRDLLGAVARSPVMLSYLDNEYNVADPGRATSVHWPRPTVDPSVPFRGPTGLNENYARELLELHTLGVDGGYTQNDVVEVARAFSGWRHSYTNFDPLTGRTRFMPRVAPPVFVFEPMIHDAEVKTVLGVTLPPGRGMEDGNDVLDILARHPSTARHIAHKLAVRFVSDSPPPALVERAAAVFLRTNGDIREVMRTIAKSPEFFAAEAIGAKVKSPLELVLSTRRAMAAPPDTAAEAIDLLIALGQPPWGMTTPQGWPETGAAWVNAGSVMRRLDMAGGVASGTLPSIPVEAWPVWSRLSNQPFNRQVEGVIDALLGGVASPSTRAAMGSMRPDLRGAAAGPAGEDPGRRAFRALIALALASPEFQRR